MEQASKETDHADADCILIAVLSHGELGILYASDHAYKPDRLWTQFNAEQCPSLAGRNAFCTNNMFVSVHTLSVLDGMGTCLINV